MKDSRTWIEINKNAAKHNYSTFRSLVDKQCRLAAVVKSNAYGHGLVEFSKTMDEAGAGWLAVDSLGEAVELRESGISKPILILGFTPHAFLHEAKNFGTQVTISSLQQLKNLARLKPEKRPAFHLKINTGMNRQGINPKEAGKAAEIMNRYNIPPKGVYTHFAKAIPDSEETHKQIGAFNHSTRVLKNKGIQGIKHAAASSGAIVFPESHFNMVRPGIGLYGLWTSEKVKKEFEKSVSLKPVLRWKTVISETKELPKESGMGYGFSEKLARNSIVAICPVGYWHGIPVQASRKGEVAVRGKKAKILGRVMMDMIIIDITEIRGARPGDEVEIIGEKITADDWAKHANTVNYEIITRINPAIERRYVK